jgi:hypothetical protein
MPQASEFSRGAEAWADNTPAPRLNFMFPWGLNENPTPDPGECSAGANFELGHAQTSLIPRVPFDLKGTATNAGAITGFLQLIKRDNTETTLVAAGTTCYQWDGASTFTSKGAINGPAFLRGAYWSLGEYLVISDVTLNNVMLTWDGTSLANMVTGLGATLSAKYAVVHLNRVWLFNIKSGSTLLPHMILACKFEDPTTWDTSTRGGPTTVGGGSFSTGLEAFFLLVPDLKPINGVTLFQDQLIISTDRGRLWNLSGSSASTFQFTDFFDTSPAIGTESVASIGNDVLYVRQGGAIALLSATQNFGNVFLSNLSNWIPMTTANLATINAIVYDVLNQKVLVFIPNKVLVLYKDVMIQDRTKIEGALSPWSVYTTQDASGFNVQHAMYMWRPGTQNYSVFFGDATGRIFDLYGVGTNGDAGASGIQVSRRSRHVGTEVLNPWPWAQENITGHIRYRRLSAMSASITLDWDDEYNTMTNTVALKGPPSGDIASYFSGSFYYSQLLYYSAGFLFANRVSSQNLDMGGKGPGFYLTISFTTNRSAQIDAIELD